MSTTIFAKPNNFCAHPHVRYGKNCVVSNERMTDRLADYIRRVINQKDLKYRVIKQQSGNKISPSTITDILKGKYDSVSGDTLVALADGLGVPKREIFAIAYGEPLSEEGALLARFSSLLEKIEKLKPTDKEFVLSGLEALNTQVEKALESYEKAPALYGIDGNKGINIRELVRTIRRDYPEFDAAEILDILDNHEIEKYTDEQIKIVREYEDRFKKKGDQALKTTG